MFRHIKAFFYALRVACSNFVLGDKTPRHYWTAYRFHGGGVISSPVIMSEEEAVRWVSTAIKGEVAYIDREHGFIFYRPKE